MLLRLARLNPDVAAHVVRAFDDNVGPAQSGLRQLLTGEGQFAEPDATITAWLAYALQLELQSWLSYFTYGQIVRGLYRSNIADMFGEHADEEAGHAEQLLLWLTTMQELPVQALQNVQGPPLSLKIADMIRVLIGQEQKALEAYRLGLTMAGTKEGFRQMIETIIEAEQEHSNELLALCRSLDGVDP